MKTKKQSCCLCFGIIAGGNIVDSYILDLFRFLIVNVDTNALENSTVCDSCLNKIVETCNYKTRNSSKMLMETKKEIDFEKLIVCQKCEKVCEQGDTFSLVDCITQIDWSDFVNYLFVDQESRSLESLQICDSCRASVSDIQDFLKLIYVYDQSKMKCDIETCDDIKTTGNKNFVEEIQIKKEFEFIVDDKATIGNITEDVKTEVENVNEDNKTEICDDYINYVDFKCKNEEVDLKLEYDRDESQSTNQCEKADVGKEMINGGSNKNSSINEEELGENSQGCRNRLKYDLHVHNSIRDFRCTYCSEGFVNKCRLDNHFLRIHKCRDGVTSKIHDCDKCSFITTIKSDMLKHTLKHAVKMEVLEKYKCQNCMYETCNKNNLIRHMKKHNNVQGFQCTCCPKKFTNRQCLDDHLLKVHNNKDNVTSKIHKCDKCNYKTTNKDHFLRHQLKHGIKVELRKFKCHNCIYETYSKNHLTRHTKTHNNIRDFKCPLCSKSFADRQCLDDHLLKVHKNTDSVTSKIHECDKCNYSTTKKADLLEHKLKHNIKIEGLCKYKCQNCIYETYKRSHLIRHIKRHKNIRNFQCTLCSKNFAYRIVLNEHLLNVHKMKDNVTSKIHQCDKCSYETTIKSNLSKHTLKHGVKIEGLKKHKCQYCIYETYNKNNLIRHIKMHKNIRDFKCNLCSKNFTARIHLDEHLLKLHKSKNNVISKIHECDTCSYETTNKSKLLRHKLKHGIKVEGLKKHKCQYCIYETYNKSSLNRHIKIHKNIEDFKCT